MSAMITGLYRYPVKGLSADTLESVDLTAGDGLPHDRRFALAHTSTRFDPEAPQWLPKTSFWMLMRDEKLAMLQTTYDPETACLEVYRDGKRVSRGRLTDPLGRACLEDFFGAFMGERTYGKPHIIEAQGDFMFSDHLHRVVSIINLASVRDLERVTGQPVDPLRFRGNIYIDGIDPWSEFDWIGDEIAIVPAEGNGARLKVTVRIDRCAATNVDPQTGARDMNIPKALQRGFGHIDMGVYAAVVADGPVSRGDRIAVTAAS